MRLWASQSDSAVFFDRKVAVWLLLTVLVCLAGCNQEGAQPTPGSRSLGDAPESIAGKIRITASSTAPVVVHNRPTVSGSSDKHEPASDQVYIDSVPQGATVYLLNEKGDDSKGAVIGKTPLVLSASKCSAMRFCIQMDLAQYIETLEVVPEMADWISTFRSDQHFGGLSFGAEYFDFDSAVSRVVKTPQGGLIAIGPIYDLRWPSQNRVCALFIPRGMSPSQFFPLMPEADTFPRLQGRWPSVLYNEYRLTEKQANEAVECLTRCGKFVAVVQDPFKNDIAREYAITVQGGSVGGVTTTIREIRRLPHLDD